MKTNNVNDMSEPSSLLALKDTLEIAQRNTAKMLSKLQRFEARLDAIDQKMRPVQVQTAKYWTAKENIQLTLQEVDKTFEYFRIAGETKPLITAGLQLPTKDQYFIALSKLTAAKKFFENHREIKSSGSELVNIETLLKAGMVSCSEVMEKILVAGGRSLTGQDGSYTVVNPLSSEATKDIVEICALMESINQSVHLKTYQRVRIAQVKADLKAHEADHASEWLALTQDAPYQKGTHPLKEFYTYAFEMLRGELQLWGETLPGSPESLLVFVAICDAVILELQRVMAPVLMEDFKSGKSSNSILKQTNTFLIRLDMLDIFASRFDDFRELCRPDVRHESTASLAAQSLKNAMVEACVDSVAVLLASSLDANKSAEKADTGKGKATSSTEDPFADSCDLHPLTGNVLHCCKELSGFASVYKTMADLAMDNGTPLAANANSVQDLIFALLENVFQFLQTKAHSFDSGKKLERRTLTVSDHAMYDADEKIAEGFVMFVRKDLFLANNLFSMSIFLMERTKELQEVDKGGAKRGASAYNNPLTSQQFLRQLSAFADKVRARLTKAESDFVATLMTVLALSPEDMQDFKSLLSKDKDNKGRVLKSKFTLFNTGMESFLAQQGEWRVSASGLREHLSNKLVEAILPVYSEFFDNYSKVNFSKKHMSMYLRFPPKDVERVFKTFFGKI